MTQKCKTCGHGEDEHDGICCIGTYECKCKKFIAMEDETIKLIDKVEAHYERTREQKDPMEDVCERCEGHIDSLGHINLCEKEQKGCGKAFSPVMKDVYEICGIERKGVLFLCSACSKQKGCLHGINHKGTCEEFEEKYNFEKQKGCEECSNIYMETDGMGSPCLACSKSSGDLILKPGESALQVNEEGLGLITNHGPEMDVSRDNPCSSQGKDTPDVVPTKSVGSSGTQSLSDKIYDENYGPKPETLWMKAKDIKVKNKIDKLAGSKLI